jgi:hypothetical protein
VTPIIFSTAIFLEKITLIALFCTAKTFIGQEGHNCTHGKTSKKNYKKLEKNVRKTSKKCSHGEKHMTEVGFEPTPEDQCLKLAP